MLSYVIIYSFVVKPRHLKTPKEASDELLFCLWQNLLQNASSGEFHSSANDEKQEKNVFAEAKSLQM